MSTTILVIHGKQEVHDTPGNQLPTCKDQVMWLTRFAGPKESGMMLQVSIGHAYIQFTAEQVSQLLEVLTRWSFEPEFIET